MNAASRDSAEPASRLRQLAREGQSVWVDYLRRDFIEEGRLAALVERDGVTGVTSNPSIFEKAIVDTRLYDEDFKGFLRTVPDDAGRLYEQVAIRDIRAAADVLRKVYDHSARRDGYVSLEVSPHVAGDTAATLDEARRLWRAVERPNVMIKVPGTPAGIPAVRQLIAEGINVNVTLLFSRTAYEAVVDAFIGGLERAPGDPGRIASVASFFVSRIDSEADAAIRRRLPEMQGAGKLALERLLGRIGIANAKAAYQLWKTLFSTARWQRLAGRGASPQRLLWASTGTKDPAYSDVLYVEGLIGPNTVNTMPLATLEAFRDHGKAAPTLEQDTDEARAQLDTLERSGISLGRITEELLVQGVRRFADDFDGLLAGVARKRAGALGSALVADSTRIPDAFAAAVGQELDAWRRGGHVRRLWRGDRSLWTCTDEDRWVGWLKAVDRELQDTARTAGLGGALGERGIEHIVLLGMGGSSLGPQVVADTLRPDGEHPRFHMLDSTDPDQVARLESAIDMRRAQFIVSSKSGTTLEPNVFMRYFHARAAELLGAREAGRRFIAITDPGSALEREAAELGFDAVFFGDPAIGGRYSVLSKFGVVPAACIGLDVAGFLRSAKAMAGSCDASVPPAENPGVRLGVALGVLGRQGRDKVTVVAGSGMESFGAWLEQLVAESTGKQGHGLIPVDGEPLGSSAVYGDDRVFVYIRLNGRADAGTDQRVAELAAAGHPVFDFVLAEPVQLAQLFFMWEVAIATAGAVLHLNPFDQPDVEASKVKTRALTTAFEKTGTLPEAAPIFRDDGCSVYADEANRASLAGSESVAALLRAHLGRIRAGDYVALLAYIEHNADHAAVLQSMRRVIRDRTRAATCVGFGPRFLHSTGQAYKGGPNSGVFLQITADHARDVPVPGSRYSFGVVEAAQAQGDLEVLSERGRRALRIHLHDVEAGLRTLAGAIEQACASL